MTRRSACFLRCVDAKLCGIFLSFQHLRINYSLQTRIESLISCLRVYNRASPVQEALIVNAEAAADCAAQPRVLLSLLEEAGPPLRQAVWLLRERIAELSHMRTDLAALAAAKQKLLHARVTAGKVALAGSRLLNRGYIAGLKEAEDAIRTDDVGCNDAEALLTRAELLEAIAECGRVGVRVVLDEGVRVCRAAVALFESAADGESAPRRVEAYVLLGDLCLARVRGEADRECVAALVGDGARAYEAAIRAGEGAEGVQTESETFYNMACLIVLGLAKECAVQYSEPQIAELLKRSVHGGGVGAADLDVDQDLAHVRESQWFVRLLEYASKHSKR